MFGGWGLGEDFKFALKSKHQGGLENVEPSGGGWAAFLLIRFINVPAAVNAGDIYDYIDR